MSAERAAGRAWLTAVFANGDRFVTERRSDRWRFPERVADLGKLRSGKARSPDSGVAIPARR